MPIEPKVLLCLVVAWIIVQVSRHWLDRYWFYRGGFIFWAAVAAFVTPADPVSLFVVGGPLFCLHFMGMWAYYFWRRAQAVH